MVMHYVYILQSRKDKSFYTGATSDLQKRCKEHNNGSARFSSAKATFILAWYSAIQTKEKALDFEKYLKQGSGFAFARKRLV
jgi:predicted GIY-YIG superfamily endonuclease